MPTPLVIAILAGGRSRRMGTPKALLKLGRGTVVERVVAAVRPLDLPVVGIAADSGASSGQPDLAADLPDPLTELLHSLDVAVYADLEPDRGPLGGLQAAFAHTRAREVMLLACDLPFLSSDFLRFLRDRCPLTGDALVPVSTSSGPEPLCAVYSESCRAELGRTISGPDLSIRRFIETIDTRLLTADEFGHLDPDDVLFTNLNTPRDYERARKMVRK